MQDTRWILRRIAEICITYMYTQSGVNYMYFITLIASYLRAHVPRGIFHVHQKLGSEELCPGLELG